MSYLSTIGPRSVFSIVWGLFLLVAPHRLQGQTGEEHWIDKRLREQKYSLSAAEKEGLYFCSLREVEVFDVEFHKGFATVTLHSSAPRSFKLTEVAAPLLAKLTGLMTGQPINLLCVHSFHRGDWQARYDEDGTVHHRLVDVEVIEDTHVYLTW